MIQKNVHGIDLKFETDISLFSPSRLDVGSLAMLSIINFDPNDKILDLGCGYGLVGIYASKFVSPDRVWMTDKDPVALRYARTNLSLNHTEGVHIVLSDGFHDLKETNFSKIICNPPYHVDFAVPKHFIEKGFNRLLVGGQMFLVTKRKPWYQNKLRSIFGGSRVRMVDAYFVFEATKNAHSYASQP